MDWKVAALDCSQWKDLVEAAVGPPDASGPMVLSSESMDSIRSNKAFITRLSIRGEIGSPCCTPRRILSKIARTDDVKLSGPLPTTEQIGIAQDIARQYGTQWPTKTELTKARKRVRAGRLSIFPEAIFTTARRATPSSPAITLQFFPVTMRRPCGRLVLQAL